MNKVIIFYLLVVSLTLSACSKEKFSYTQYVNPFIGSAATGHTYPGAIRPFGMVSASPDTGTEGWALCSGYHSKDSSIIGFSHTHMSGTGAADMGDIMLMPLTGKPRFEPGTRENPDEGYRSRFSHDTEKASPGFYSVKLEDYNISTKVTVSDRSAFYCFDFPKNQQAGILFDMLHGIGDKTIDCNIEKVDNYRIRGFRQSSGFINNHIYYFFAEFSEPCISILGYKDSIIIPENELKNKTNKLYLQFESGKQIMLKIGLSTVSEKGAENNLKTEIPHWDFDKTQDEADIKWNEYLSKTEIDAIDEDNKTIFYTALYHSLITPNLITDVNGEYRGWDKKTNKSHKGNLYTNYSLWDTYRAVHPLYNLLFPYDNLAFINSMLERYRQIGQLPINEYGTNETYCMIGYHSIPVLADAIMRNAQGFNYEEAYLAMKDAAMDEDRGVGLMLKFGYIPSELEDNSVSKVLEYAYDDWCIAQVAKKLDKKNDYNYFINRALYYKNHFDSSTGFMRGRKVDGSWVEPFDPRAVSGLGQHDFTEGNSWQYSFYVPQDMNTLIDLMGGKDSFTTKLDTLFKTRSTEELINIPDVTGLIGQYAHGNEPSHHIAYLYNFVGQPSKTQEVVNKIKSTLYMNSRDGLCGNDDCGQMSSWYVYSTLGFYPVTPGIDYYVIGSPSIKYAKLNFENGKTFEIIAPAASSKNIYIHSVKLNGQAYSKSYINISDIKQGGKIEFVMSAIPNSTWATDFKDCPISIIRDIQ